MKTAEGFEERVSYLDVAAFAVTISPALRDAQKGDTVRVEGFLRQERCEDQRKKKHSKHKLVARTVRVQSKAVCVATG